MQWDIIGDGLTMNGRPYRCLKTLNLMVPNLDSVNRTSVSSGKVLMYDLCSKRSDELGARSRWRCLARLDFRLC